MSGGRSALAAFAVFLVVALWRRIFRRRGPVDLRPRLAAIVAAAFLGAAVVRILAEGAVTLEEVLPPSPASAAARASGPSIYLIVLDAYARQDTIAVMGFDNEPFLAELERRGFDAYRDSRSNYEWTSSTLASTLDMRPLHEIRALPSEGAPDLVQTRALRRSINDSRG